MAGIKLMLGGVLKGTIISEWVFASSQFLASATDANQMTESQNI
jgi:hypothetical protein